MKRQYLIVTAALLISLVSGCASYYYVPVENEQVMVIAERGLSIAVIEEESMRINAQAGDEKEHIRFRVEIKNNSDAIISINENCATIRQGTAPGNMIEAKKTYTASEFLEKESDSAATMACCLCMGAVASSASAARDGTVSSRLNEHIAYENLDKELEESASYLVFLRNNLLFTSDILPGKKYRGLVYGDLWKNGFDSGVKTDSTMISITLRINEKEYVFLFSRNKVN
ncbi:MAG: hypothetical protein EHM28_06635 [Spirochaetaceae bacterium]|nr:MAG: hypothetical protein EHM28_06635 [Spirochaetaceae bacterium]